MSLSEVAVQLFHSTHRYAQTQTQNTDTDAHTHVHAGPEIQCQLMSRYFEQRTFRYKISIKEFLISSYRGKPINKVKTQD